MTPAAQIDRESVMRSALEDVKDIHSLPERISAYCRAGVAGFHMTEDQTAYSHELNRRISLSNSEATDDAP